MAELLPGPVKTFSIGFDAPEYSEVDYAARVAEVFHTEHHVEQTFFKRKRDSANPDSMARRPRIRRDDP